MCQVMIFNMKNSSTETKIAMQLETINEMANNMYHEGVVDGYEIAIRMLKSQANVLTTDTGSSLVWADWLEFKKKAIFDKGV